MKEENGNQGVGATAWEYGNSQHPGYVNKIYYGNQNVPMPNNKAAMKSDASAIMNAVLDAK